MLEFFHELGVFMYFKEESLKNYVILDPQWLIDRIVCIIRDFNIHPLRRDSDLQRDCPHKWKEFVFKGVLSSSMLSVLWEEEYIANRDFLVSMLKKLLLVCELPPRTLQDGTPSEDTYYLVPSLLQPSDASARKPLCPFDENEFSGTIKLSFRPFLPGTYLPRLIVALTASITEYTPFSMNITESGSGSKKVMCNGDAPCLFSYQEVYTAAVSIASYPVLLYQQENSIFIYVCNCEKPIVGKSIENLISVATSQLSNELLYKNVDVVHSFPKSYTRSNKQVYEISAEIPYIRSANYPVERQRSLVLNRKRDACIVSAGPLYSDLASSLATELSKRNLSIFQSKDLRISAIKNSICFVACISRDFMSDENCLNEYRVACEEIATLKIIFVMLERDFSPDSHPPVSSTIMNNLGPDGWLSLFDKSAASEVSGEISHRIKSLCNEKVESSARILQRGHAVTETITELYISAQDEERIAEFQKWFSEPPPDGKVKGKEQQKKISTILVCQRSINCLEELIKGYKMGIISRKKLSTWLDNREGDCVRVCDALQALIQSSDSKASAEKKAILDDPNCKLYYELFQRTFNQAFTIALIMATGTFVLSPSMLSRCLGVVASLANDVPIAGMILSLAQKITDTINGASVKASYLYISELNRSGNSELAGRYSESIARKFTIIRKSKIMSLSTAEPDISQKSFLVNLLKECFPSDSVDAFMGSRMFKAVELLAFKDSKAALELILRGEVSNLNDFTDVVCTVANALMVSDDEAVNSNNGYVLENFQENNFDFTTSVRVIKGLVDEVCGSKQRMVRERKTIFTRMSSQRFIYIDEELRGDVTKAPARVKGSRIIEVLGMCGVEKVDVQKLHRKLK